MATILSSGGDPVASAIVPPDNAIISPASTVAGGPQAAPGSAPGTILTTFIPSSPLGLLMLAGGVWLLWKYKPWRRI